MLRIFAAALLSAALLFGCSDDATDPNTNNDPDNSFRINGAGYNNVLVQAYPSVGAMAAQSEGSGTVVLAGQSGSEVITLNLLISNVAAGTFTVSTAPPPVVCSVTIVPTSGGTQKLLSAQDGKGTITISKWEVSGSGATGTITADVTDGSSTAKITGKFNISSISVE